MKMKLLFGSIMLGLVFTSTAQITINRSDYGNIAGNSSVQANDSTNLQALSPGNAGENQTWDLTGISKDYQDTMQYLLPSGMPCSNDFASATLLLFRAGGYMYVYDDNTVFEFLGNCMVTTTPDTTFTSSIAYNPPKKQLIFPFTYNTFFSGQSRWIFQNQEPDTMRIVQTITYESLTDGWGNVITPFGTYPALRQKYTSYYTDSIFIYNAGTGWQLADTPPVDTTIDYFWLSRNNPLIALITTDGSGNIQSAEYLLSSTVGINETQDIPIAASVFPNPSTGRFTVAVRNGSINAIEIYNVLGEKVFILSDIKRQMSDEIDLSGFPKGIYFIKIYSGVKPHRVKVVIQ